MIAGDGKVVKIRVRRNEVGTGTCHWLPPTCHRHSAQLFVLFCPLHPKRRDFFLIFFRDGERDEEDGGGAERPPFCVFLLHASSGVCVCVFVDAE